MKMAARIWLERCQRLETFQGNEFVIAAEEENISDALVPYLTCFRFDLRLPVFSFNRLPTNFAWDAVDGRFVVCETRRVPQLSEKRPPTSLSTMRRMSNLQAAASSPNHLSSPTKSHTQAAIFFVKNDSKCEIKDVEILNLIAGEQIVNFWAPFVVTQLPFFFLSPFRYPQILIQLCISMLNGR